MPNARLKKTREAYADARTPAERREDEERAARDREQEQRGKVLAEGFVAVPVGQIGIAIRFVKQYNVTADVNPPRYACEWPKHWNTIEADHHPWKDGYADVTFPKLPIFQPLDEQ